MLSLRVLNLHVVDPSMHLILLRCPVMPSNTLLLILGISITGAGCSDGRPERIPVSGQVLIDGQPLEHGFVQVIPANDRAATGKLGPHGRFQLTTFETNDGCVPGTHPVAVIANESIDPQSQRWHAPKSYMNPDVSLLVVDVKEATDSLKIELTWDGEKSFVERFDAE
jgi:hypothetical protein